MAKLDGVFTNKSEYLPAPGMVMALGIWLLFAGPHLLTRMGLDEATLDQYLGPVSYGLLLLAVVIFATIAVRFARAPQTFLQPTADNFGMGTWAAGANVLAVALAKFAHQSELAQAFNILGWVCWAYYIAWFVRRIAGGEMGDGINGAALLTTVSTQSVVISSLHVWPWAEGMLPLFLALNFLGLALYVYVFFYMWIVRGVRAQLENWVAPNNITHGALSISVLAQVSLYMAAPERLSFLVWSMSVIWAFVVLFFVAVLTAELRMLLSAERSRVVDYRMVNFARNFTYGMFFACTYAGATQVPESLMAHLVAPAVFVGLAVLVAGINLWEITNQMRHYVGGTERAAAVPGAGPRSGQIHAPLLICLSVVITVAGAVAYYSPKHYAWLGNQTGYAPQQPIEFSHKVHAKDNSIDCEYCHFSARKAAVAGVPPAGVCMNCHSETLKDSDEVKKIAAAIENDVPIEWVRVHDIADFVHFDHSAHVTKGVECQTCHGAVEEMPRIEQTQHLSMGWCVKCHREYAVSPPEGVEDVAPPTECSTCHF